MQVRVFLDAAGERVKSVTWLFASFHVIQRIELQPASVLDKVQALKRCLTEEKVRCNVGFER